MVRVPPLRYGQPAVLAENGVELELAFGSDNRSPWSVFGCAPRPSPTGGGMNRIPGPVRSPWSAQRFWCGNPNERTCLHASAAHAATWGPPSSPSGA